MWVAQGRHFAVKPFLLLSQRGPTLGHACVTPEHRPSCSALGKLQAVISVFSKSI